MILAAFGFLGFLASWLGFAIFVLYMFIVSALFEEDWWIRGVVFLAVPIGIAMGIGVMGIPSWGQAAWILGGYFLAGLSWSFFRWRIFVKDFREVLEKILQNKHESWENLTTVRKGEWIYSELWDKKDYSNYQFRNHLNEKEAKQELKLVPNVSNWECKARVGSWIVYWPFSFLNYAYTRLLKDFVDFVIEKLKGVYNAIASSVMEGLQI